MGWYVRKSFRTGPVRWNLSKSGIGVSAGVRGLRVGTGPRGAYISGGRGGIYFRQRLGTAPRGAHPSPRLLAPRHYAAPTAPIRPPAPTPSHALPTPTAPTAPMAPMEYLPETNVAQFQPSSADALAQYIVEQRKHFAWFPWTVVLLIIINVMMLANIWPLAIVTLPLSAVGGYYLYQWDRQRTHVALHYDLDSQEGQQFERLCSGLASLASTARLQRVEARQQHGDWKHQAGTTASLQLAPAVVLRPGHLRWMETNVPVWGIEWRQGGIALSFLPDRIVIEQQRAVAVVPYTDVQVSASLGRFVEGRGVPPDSRILGYNWQYPNKNGGPDRRFRNNRQLPVIEAVYISLQSAHGLQLLLQASSRTRAEDFINSIKAYKPLVCAEVGTSA